MTHPFPIITKSKAGSLPLYAVSSKDFPAWLKRQPAPTKHWLEANGFKANSGTHCLIPGKDGELAGAVFGINEKPDIWSIAQATSVLPEKTFHLEVSWTAETTTQMVLGWILGSYKFTRYKKNDKPVATLIVPDYCDLAYIKTMAASICWARDLINTPANDMDPAALADEAVSWAELHNAKIKVITGEALLKANYPMIYAVGKASSVPPRLVDINFPRKGAPKITLVGKGVCFDSGGLDIKSASGMKMMKKDMGGAANVLALARVIVEMKLPVQLRVLLPIVENAVAGNAMRPLDIVATRKGITVEIGNTDAEGRLILCDALTEADSDKPDLLIDCATLTGAARVALGTEIPAFFTGDDKLAAELMTHVNAQADPAWRLPLWKNYRSQLDTNAADLSNDPDSSYGGAITAALYLQEFVSMTPSWLHIDMMAWNPTTKPGRPLGGEAMVIRALYALLEDRYGTS